GREPPLIRCAENGASQMQQAVHLVVIEAAIARVEQALVAVENADGLPAAFGRGLDHRANDRVQARTIAATRENAEALAHGFPTPIQSSRAVCWSRRARRGSLLSLR